LLLGGVELLKGEVAGIILRPGVGGIGRVPRGVGGGLLNEIFQRCVMSLDRSLKSANSLIRHRNVLTRAERLDVLKDQEKWTEEKSVFGLPKVGHRKQAIAKDVKEETAEGAAPAAGGATGAAPAAGAKGAAPTGGGAKGGAPAAAAGGAKGAAPAAGAKGAAAPAGKGKK
jgi:small basic protein (TIGR04137 family)